MNIAKAIAHNSLIQIIGKIISVGVAIGAVAILTRYLGTEQFGWYTTTMAFLQLFGILADFGLVLITAQMLSEHTHRQSHILNNLFTFRLLSAFILIGLAPLIVLFLPYPQPIKQAVALTSLMFFAIAMQQIFTGLFQKHLAMHFATIAEIAGRLVLIGGVATVAYFNLGFMAAMGTMVISGTAQLAILYIYGLRFSHISFSFDYVVWHEIMTKSYPIAISIVFNMIYLRADILILSLTHSQTDVGLYGAAYKILDVITQLPILFMGLMIPLMTAAWIHKRRDELQLMIEKSMHVFMVMGLPIIVGGMMLSDRIMRVIAGSDFVSSGVIARILFLALIGAFVGALFGHVIVAINKQKQAIWIYATVAIVGIIGYLVVIPLYATIGAAWMTVATEGLAGLLLGVYVCHHIKPHVRWIGVLLKSLAACGIMILPILIFPQLHVIALILIAMLLYALTILALRTFSADDLKKILT